MSDAGNTSANCLDPGQPTHSIAVQEFFHPPTIMSSANAAVGELKLFLKHILNKTALHFMNHQMDSQLGVFKFKLSQLVKHVMQCSTCQSQVDNLNQNIHANRFVEMQFLTSFISKGYSLPSTMPESRDLMGLDVVIEIVKGGHQLQLCLPISVLSSGEFSSDS